MVEIAEIIFLKSVVLYCVFSRTHLARLVLIPSSNMICDALDGMDNIALMG
jgi:hypothetical protein